MNESKLVDATNHPLVGALLKCLVCALDKPWGVIHEPTGVAVCIECRDAARNRAEHEAMERRLANTCFKHRDTGLIVRIVDNPPADGKGLVYCPKCEAEHEAAIAAVVEKAAQHFPYQRTLTEPMACACGWKSNLYGYDMLTWQAHLKNSLASQDAQDALREAKADAYDNGFERAMKEATAILGVKDALKWEGIGKYSDFYTAIRKREAQAVKAALDRLSLVLDARIAELKDSVLDLQDLRKAMDKVKDGRDD